MLILKLFKTTGLFPIAIDYLIIKTRNNLIIWSYYWFYSSSWNSYFL